MTELGLDLAYATSCIICELVIVGFSDNTLPTANSSETSTVPPAYEPPSQDSPASPPQYDFKDHPVKYGDPKGKEI